MKRLLFCVAVLACASVSATAQAAKSKPKPVSCGATFGVISPVTGPAATIGQEIVDWTRLSVANWNKQHHDHFKLVEADDQLSPAQASTIAQSFASNSKIVATVGPAASQNAAAAGPILAKAKIAMVSPSATATNLTIGASFHDFFRVVPRDDEQGPTAANFLMKTLKLKSVMIIDDQSSFGLGLAASAAPVFHKAGVSVDRESVQQNTTDFSALVAKASSVSAIFLAWQLPADIKLFVQQLQQQGRSTPTFATTFDGGTNYVSSFSVNAHTYPPDAAISKQYEKTYGTNYTGEFGPPSYVSAQVIMSAADSLCKTHKPVTRSAMLAAIRKVKIRHSIIGRSIAFDKNGDLIGGTFYIYKLVNDTYQIIQ
jgi:branched-chain amino acid transport system substrate-binding protein